MDFDLAELYNVETRVFNQAVKRNIENFPEEFMFRLTSDEWKILIAQAAASGKQSGGNQSVPSSQFVMMENLPKNRTGKYLPYAFTEHGVTMLASVLKSPTARKMNVAIVKAFIIMRRMVIQYAEVLKAVDDLRERIDGHDGQLNQIYDALENMLDRKAVEENRQKGWDERERIGFKK